jgi:Flp pilus assembly protein TadD
MMVLWDLLHSAVFGVMLLGAFSLGEVTKHFLEARLPGWDGATAMPTRRLRWLLICAGATVLLMLLSPYGPLSYVTFTDFITGNPLVSVIAELQPTSFHQFPIFWGLFALAFVSIAWARRRADLTQVLILLPFAYLAVRYNRAVAVFGLVAVPLLARNISLLANSLPSAGHVLRLRWALLALGILGSTAWLTYTKLLVPGGFYAFGTGINSDVFPIGSVRFVKEVGLTGNMYNTDRFGGYLSYFLAPERRIFQYPHHEVFKDTLSEIHDTSLPDRWDVNYAIIGEHLELQYVFTPRDWVSVYREPAAVLVVKRSERNRDIVGRYAIHYFDPMLPSSELRKMAKNTRVFPGLVREMATHLHYRGDRRIADLLGELLLVPNRAVSADERISLLERAERYNAKAPSLLAALGMSYYRAKRFDEALETLSAASALDAQRVDVRLSLAYLHYDLGEFQPAAAGFQRLLSDDPENTDALYGMGLTLYRMGEHAGAGESFRRFLALVPSGPWAEKARAILAEMSGS